MLEVNICAFVVLVELSDVDAEVLVEGPVSSGVMEGKYCIEIRLFFGQGTYRANYLHTRLLRRTQY